MSERAWVGTYRIVFALLTLAIIGYQFTTQVERPGFVPGNFFSLFTIQGNLIAGFLFLVLALRQSIPSPALDLTRGAVAAWMTLMSVVHALLLSGGPQSILQAPDLSVNTMQHKVMPLVVVLDWILRPPRSRIGFARATIWTVYPLMYLGYTLVRGSRVNWYPYGFLDPGQDGGYSLMVAVCAVIMVGFLIASWLLVMIGQRLRIHIDPYR